MKSERVARLCCLALTGTFSGLAQAAPMKAVPIAEFVSGEEASVTLAVNGVVDRPDVALHYKVFGDKGPHVVLLAGGPGGSVSMMQPICDHLKDRFR